MPYTPPSHRSPASSASASPDTSRRPSFQSGSRPALPRSASYLSKHRRTPSVTAISDGSVGSLTPQGTSEDLSALAAGVAVRQSPRPRTSDRGMPKGAVISPPDSASSGSDDETTPEVGGRRLGKLKDLRDAVSQLPPTTGTPPPRDIGETSDGSTHDTTPRGMRISFSTSALTDMHDPHTVGQARSATEPDAPVVGSADNSFAASEEDTDEDLKDKPHMVRKKSGELVRPALRPSSRRRPSSMPGTPVFSKAVHFDSHLEHVRHFLQVDRPLAVSAGSSPVENHESDNEYPFPGAAKPAIRTPPFEWEVVTPSFPQDTLARKALPVRLERVWMSDDQKSMLGSVAAANLAFQKHITCRFTLDYWETTSEVSAEYCNGIPERDTLVGYDRFAFSVKLSDTANLESKTLFFCIRYSVNGHEYWDNNNHANFQVDFRKKHLPQNGKNNFQGATARPRTLALPRSNRRQTPPEVPRPNSVPVGLSEFDAEPQLKFGQPLHEYLGESGPPGLRLRTRSSGSIASDNMSTGLSSPSGAAFANRYDFGASLSAAVQAGKDSVGKDKDGLYMKANPRPPRSTPDAGQGNPPSTPSLNSGAARSHNGSPVPSLPSASYEELVNKYCFFGTKTSNPAPKDGNVRGGRFGGPRGEATTATNRAPSRSHQLAAASYDRTKPCLVNSSSSVPPPESPSPHYLPVGGGSPSPALNATPDETSVTPKYATLAGAPSTEDSYSTQQHLPERFSWREDTHTTPAVRG